MKITSRVLVSKSDITLAPVSPSKAEGIHTDFTMDTKNRGDLNINTVHTKGSDGIKLAVDLRILFEIKFIYCN